jgi:hypothetical protein
VHPRRRRLSHVLIAEATSHGAPKPQTPSLCSVGTSEHTRSSGRADVGIDSIICGCIRTEHTQSKLQGLKWLDHHGQLQIPLRQSLRDITFIGSNAQNALRGQNAGAAHETRYSTGRTARVRDSASHNNTPMGLTNRRTWEQGWKFVTNKARARVPVSDRCRDLFLQRSLVAPHDTSEILPRRLAGEIAQ